MGGGNGGGNPETGDDSYIYNGEGIGQQPTEGYDGKKFDLTCINVTKNGI